MSRNDFTVRLTSHGNKNKKDDIIYDCVKSINNLILLNLFQIAFHILIDWIEFYRILSNGNAITDDLDKMGFSLSTFTFLSSMFVCFFSFLFSICCCKKSEIIIVIMICCMEKFNQKKEKKSKTLKKVNLSENNRTFEASELFENHSFVPIFFFVQNL